LQERGASLGFALNKIAVISDRIRRAYATGHLQTVLFVASQGLQTASGHLGGDPEPLLEHLHRNWPLWDRGSMSEEGGRLNRAILAEQDAAAKRR